MPAGSIIGALYHKL